MDLNLKPKHWKLFWIFVSMVTFFFRSNLFLAATSVNSHLVSDVIFAINSRGQTVLICGGYTYHVNKRGTNISWQCSDYDRTKCRCRCVTTPQGEIRMPRVPHNHPPDTERIKKRRFGVKSIMTPNEFFETQQNWKLYIMLFVSIKTLLFFIYWVFMFFLTYFLEVTHLRSFCKVLHFFNICYFFSTYNNFQKILKNTVYLKYFCATFHLFFCLFVENWFKC